MERDDTSAKPRTTTFVPAKLRLSDGSALPIQIHQTESSVLFECEHPREILSHLFEVQFDVPLNPSQVVRGIIAKGEGAYVQVFDNLGALTPEIGPLDEHEIGNRLWKSLVTNA